MSFIYLPFAFVYRITEGESLHPIRQIVIQQAQFYLCLHAQFYRQGCTYTNFILLRCDALLQGDKQAGRNAELQEIQREGAKACTDRNAYIQAEFNLHFRRHLRGFDDPFIIGRRQITILVPGRCIGDFVCSCN